ncbi:IclR family transcriptional regulator [Magnetovibrio sp.]|uniref:IclR family transcriptional regulator n=1 Tax=Magnetovibrio sp. TaxID=2024836 RepID=UPI002F9219FB
MAKEVRRKARIKNVVKKSGDSSGQVQSLCRALSILNVIADDDHGMTMTDISQRAGLPMSTTHRLLTTLQHERYVRYDNDQSLWKMGVQAFIIGNAFVRSRDIIATSRPFMAALMEKSGETVNLAVADQGECIYLAQVECRQMMRVQAKPGSRVPIHSSAVGKALLAAMPVEKAKKFIQMREFERATDNTVIDQQALCKEIEEVRETGFAYDDEEHCVGLRCVASAIFDEFGEPIAAVSLSGPMARVGDDRFPVLGGMVKECAAEITAAMGGVVPKSKKTCFCD